jgi:serine phosphatase RsbU (regulator of sigma subunit)
MMLQNKPMEAETMMERGALFLTITERATSTTDHRGDTHTTSTTTTPAHMLHRTLLEMQQDLLLTQTELFQGLSHQVVVATESEQLAWNQVEELKASLIEAKAALQQTKEELYEQRKQNQQLETRIEGDMTQVVPLRRGYDRHEVLLS